MIYRGFRITTCYDSGVERCNDKTGEPEVFDGYFCQIYAGDDDAYADQIDSFCLAVDHEIEDISENALNSGVRKYVDDMYFELQKELANRQGKGECV